MTQIFPLAPMASPIRWLTWLLLVLPVGFAMAAVTRLGHPGLLWIAVLLAALYAAVWIWWRPDRFEISSAGLVLIFPGRRSAVPASQLAAVSVLDRQAFRREFGHALRVGVGGLWGGFGWLWTGKGWVEFYVSTLDRYVLIHRRRRMPLLLSPQDPERMVAALKQVIPLLSDSASK